MIKPTTEELKELIGKVTQGEWCLDDEGWIVGNDGTDPVCMIESGGITDVFEQAKHDATIIALAPTLAAEVVRLRDALEALLALNDNYSPFGGEIYQDRIDRTWRNARQALSQK